MIDAATFGAPNWVDLSTPDIAAATGFYSELLEWEISTMTTPMGDYHVASRDGAEIGGMMAQPAEAAGQPALWTVFIYVKSVDETLERVEEAYGHVLQAPFEIPGGARVSVVSDTTGAMFAIISGGPTPHGTYMSNVPGGVCWVELLTRDVESAATFYKEVFGWSAAPDTTGDTEYTMFKLGGEDVAGMLMMPAEIPSEAPAHWAVYFAVADCAATTKMADELGGAVLREVTDIEIGRFAVLADPQGATFNVVEFTAID